MSAMTDTDKFPPFEQDPAALEVERKILAATKDRLRAAESDRIADLERDLAEARAEVERLRAEKQRIIDSSVRLLTGGAARSQPCE